MHLSQATQSTLFLQVGGSGANLCEKQRTFADLCCSHKTEIGLEDKVYRCHIYKYKALYSKVTSLCPWIDESDSVITTKHKYRDSAGVCKRCIPFCFKDLLLALWSFNFLVNTFINAFVKSLSLSSWWTLESTFLQRNAS
jgi:hypothetical protein